MEVGIEDSGDIPSNGVTHPSIRGPLPGGDYPYLIKIKKIPS
jgi:hypothetical protein